MFGSSARLEAAVARTDAALNSHLNDCSRRYDDTTRVLSKIQQDLENSTKERRDSIAAVDKKVEETAEKLEIKVETRHRENRKYFWSLLLVLVPMFADKIVAWISTLQHVSASH